MSSASALPDRKAPRTGAEMPRSPGTAAFRACHNPGRTGQFTQSGRSLTSHGVTRTAPTWSLSTKMRALSGIARFRSSLLAQVTSIAPGSTAIRSATNTLASTFLVVGSVSPFLRTETSIVYAVVAPQFVEKTIATNLPFGLATSFNVSKWQLNIISSEHPLSKTPNAAVQAPARHETKPSITPHHAAHHASH